MYEQNKKVVRNRKMIFLFTFLYGLTTIWIGLVNFDSMYLAVAGFIISMLSVMFYVLSEWRFKKTFQIYKENKKIITCEGTDYD